MSEGAEHLLCNNTLPGSLKNAETDITKEDRKQFSKLLKKFKKAHPGRIIRCDEVLTK